MTPLPNPFPPPATPYRGLLVLLLVIVALAAWGRANAQTACPADADCITVGYPTTYTDGSALPAADLDGGILEFKTATGWQHLTTLKYPTLTYVRQPVSGLQTYRWKVLTKVGGMSAFVEATPAKEPSPGTLKVVSNIARKPDIGYNDQVKTPQIGFVPVGTRCTEQTVNDLHVVAIGKRTVVNGQQTSPLVTDAAGKRVPVPKQVLARCEVKS